MYFRLQCWICFLIMIMKEFSNAGSNLDTWHSFRSDCFLLSSGDDAYEYIASDCLDDYGGTPMVIKDAYKMDFVNQKLSTVSKSMMFYVGLKRNSTLPDKAFTWIDGTSVLSDFWGSGFPQDPHENECGILAYRTLEDIWMLMDWECELEVFFICEKPATLITNGALVDPTFTSWHAWQYSISQLDKDNMCLASAVTLGSTIECALACVSISCHMFAFQSDNKVCQLFRIRQETCALMFYEEEFLYYMMEDDKRYSCMTTG